MAGLAMWLFPFSKRPQKVNYYHYQLTLNGCVPGPARRVLRKLTHLFFKYSCDLNDIVISIFQVQRLRQRQCKYLVWIIFNHVFKENRFYLFLERRKGRRKGRDIYVEEKH